MDDQLFEILFKDVMKMLGEKLPPNLFYHNPGHTVDVIESVQRIAVSELCNPEEILLLKIAALFHDTGYVKDMRDHEKHGCEVVREALSAHQINQDKVDIICDIIMATKVPQSPKTKLEKIICDADLDYLGREDYFTIAENLHREFVAFGRIKSEKDWIELQQNFLQAHTYFTKTAMEQRQAGVDKNLRKIGETGVK